ncbi:MAG: hypothetical protein ACM3IL_03785, partial [Deltaproteobacteria bacterium]
KALMVEPGNSTARSYIEVIFKEDLSTPAPAVPSAPSREQIITSALSEMEGGAPKEEYPNLPTPPAAEAPLPVKITGEAVLSGGFTSEDVIWKRANADLNEKNFRILSGAAFDRHLNTYDPRIYDRLRVNVDTTNTRGFNLHTNITVDPWSFTGKSQKITLRGVDPHVDTAEFQLKYWSNTGYTINEIVFTQRNGDSIALPEFKVVNGKTEASRLTTNFLNIFNLPELKISREFMPLRELWLDYVGDDYKVRVFPIAYQDQSLLSDDPLQLSNHRMWWQESPWLRRWLPGNFNSGATPVVDFTRGRWDDSLSFFTRDSDGTRLTALRGFSFEAVPMEDLSVATTFASPKGLWQEYSEVDNAINATRLKYRLNDNINLGAIYTFRMGFDEDNKKDAVNNVWGVDAGYSPWEGQKATLEVATSQSAKDLTSDRYNTKSHGNVYYFSIMGATPAINLMDLKFGYDEIKPEESSASFFAKYRFFAAHMDAGFDTALSTYRQTHKDTFWSRHLHFRTPAEYFYNGLYFPSLRWDDIKPFAIGDGIDIGRNVLGFRIETSSWDRAINNLADVRNVHDTDGNFIETVARDEFTYKITDKLTTKALGIYQHLPKTKAGFDPFIFDPETGLNFANTAIQGGKDPSLNTGSLGLEYAFTEWLAVDGIWEYTNDSTLAYDNFPRGVLNSASFITFNDNGRVFRRVYPFLYSQGLFPLPPYDYYNIYKGGINLKPIDKVTIYLDYTRNEFESAGQIDDNMNHLGFEISYLPSEKFGFYFRYTFSRWNDVNRMLDGQDKVYVGNHKFFTEFRYRPCADDELVMQYGEGGLSPVSNITFDPFGGSLSTIDTQHIIRMYYRRKF